jgi:hypothetical protein
VLSVFCEKRSDPPSGRGPVANLTALLRTCRQVHKDAELLFSECAEFNLGEEFAFYHLMTRLTDQQRSAVKNVTTSGYSVKEILREMPSFLSGEQQFPIPYDACQPFAKLPGLRIITYEAMGDSVQPNDKESVHQDNLRKCLGQFGAHEGVKLRVWWHNFGSRKAYHRITFTRRAAHWVWGSLLVVLDILSFVFYGVLGLVFLLATLTVIGGS